MLATAMTGEHTQTELARVVGARQDDDGRHRRRARGRRAWPSGVPRATDRRARVIAVTKAGERKVREAEAILDRVREDVLSLLPESERKVFLRALGRLACGRLSEPVACTHRFAVALRPGAAAQGPDATPLRAPTTLRVGLRS